MFYLDYLKMAQNFKQFSDTKHTKKLFQSLYF